MTDLDDPQALRLADPQGMLDAVLGHAERLPRGVRLRAPGRRSPRREGRHLRDVLRDGRLGGLGRRRAVRVPRASRPPRRGEPLAGPARALRPTHARGGLVVLREHRGDARVVPFGAGAGLSGAGRDLGRHDRRGGRRGRRRDRARALPAINLARPSGIWGSPRSARSRPWGSCPRSRATSTRRSPRSTPCSPTMGPDVPTEDNPAKTLATRIGDRSPVVWGADGIGSVAAARWKTQMNENGKLPAFWSSMSELDHNEVVGWTAPFGERFFVVGLRHDGEDPQLPPRFPLSYDIVRAAGGEVEEVHARGDLRARAADVAHHRRRPDQRVPRDRSRRRPHPGPGDRAPEGRARGIVTA